MDSTHPPRKLGGILGYLRYQMKMTQKEVASSVGVSVITIRNWENGRAKPAADNLKKLIEVYLQNGVFPAGTERSNVEELWQAADTKIFFDEAWFAALQYRYLSQPQKETEDPQILQYSETVPVTSPDLVDNTPLPPQHIALPVTSPELADDTPLPPQHITAPTMIAYTGNETQKNLERQNMLDLVDRIWIKGVLDKSAHRDISITMQLRELPDAVAGPLGSQPYGIYRSEEPALATTSIVEMYENAHRKLLILGEPGAGKTVQLLELTRMLLERASADATHPIPVLFNLESWAKKRQPIAKWLIEELTTKYHVPRNLGQYWIDEGQLLPLLDGLDEVSSSSRLACVDTINTYLRERGFVPIVICSRSTDYLKLPRHLLVDNTALVQPLTRQQIDTYLLKRGTQMEGLRTTLRNDTELQKLATTPFMLLILATVYENHSDDTDQASSGEDLQQHIFAIYVKRMLERRTATTHYEQKQTKYWLQWLAQQLKERNQSNFYIELMQFDWLSEHRFRYLYPGFAVGVVYGPLSAIGYGISYLPYLPLHHVLIVTLFIAVFNTLLYGLLNGVVFGVLADVYARRQTASPADRTAKKIIGVLENRIVYGFINGLLNGVFVGLLVNPVSGWICGLFSWAFCAALGKSGTQIQCAEYLSWSWESMLHNASKFLIGGLCVGLLYGLVTGRSYLFVPAHLLSPLLLGLGIGLIVGLIMSIRGGFINRVPDTYKTLKPNQGIRNAVKYSLCFGLFFGITFGLLFWFIYGPALFLILGKEFISSFPTNSGLIYGLSDGFIVGVFFWLLSGGCACIQHIMLRFILFRSGNTPWNYTRFLDYASDCMLLQQVGGSYIFVHSLLRDYIATLERD